MTNKLYNRNLIKEKIQDDILFFVYQDTKYQNLIFTGGTCLRKLYGLDRLSEDLGFDYDFKFDIDDFAFKVKKFLVSKLQYKSINLKISGSKQTLFIKMPDKNIFLGCDFSKITSKVYGLNKGMITAGKFKFLVNAYDLETMFANKIVAFLRRNFYKGKFQKVPFKGRDVYDLFWLLQLSAKSGYVLKPSSKRLEVLTKCKIDVLRREIINKISKIDPKFVYEDMLPLVESDNFLREFLKIFEKNIHKQIEMVI